MNVFRPALLSIVLLVGGLFSGCTSGPALKGLRATLVDLRPLDSTLLESRFVLTLRYVNENVVPVGLSGSKHKVYLNGTYIGQAVSNEPVGLPALNSATQDVTLMVDNAALAGRLREILAARRADYRLESVLFVLAGEDKLQVKSEQAGRVDLQ